MHRSGQKSGEKELPEHQTAVFQQYKLHERDHGISIREKTGILIPPIHRPKAHKTSSRRPCILHSKRKRTVRKKLLFYWENPETAHEMDTEKRWMGKFRDLTVLSGGRTQAMRTYPTDILKVQPENRAAAAGRLGARTGRMSGQTRHSSTESGDSSILIVRMNPDPYICGKTGKNR